MHMDFGEKKTMTEEPLWLTRFLTSRLVQSSFIMFVLIVSFTIQVTVYCAEIVILYKNPKNLRTFLPWMLGKPFAMVTCLATFRSRQDIINVWGSFNRWTLDSAGEEARNEIEKKIYNHNLFVVISLGIAVAAGTFLIIPNPCNNHYFVLCGFINDRKFSHSTMICSLVIFVTGPIFLTTLIFPYLLNYITQHSIFQGYLLREHVRKITWDYRNKSDDVLIVDREYQNLMNQRIGYCVKRHIELLRLRVEMVDNFIKPYFVSFSIFGFLLGLCVGMLFYGFQQKVYDNTWFNVVTLMLIAFAAVLQFTLMITSGQDVENEFEELTSELINLNWCSWNKYNRMSLFLIYERAQRPIQIKFSENFSINYEFGIAVDMINILLDNCCDALLMFQMVKGLYSMVSVFVSVSL